MFGDIMWLLVIVFIVVLGFISAVYISRLGLQDRETEWPVDTTASGE